MGPLEGGARGRSNQSHRARHMHYYQRISQFMQRGSVLRALLGLCVLMFMLAACSSQDTTQHPQSTHVPIPSLPPIGQLPPGATNDPSTGLLPADTKLQLTIGLATDRQALADDLAAIYDPHSSQYGHFLTPA